MKDFEVSAEPVQDWLSKTEKMVHESSNRLYDLPAKRREQQKLQVTRPGWSDPPSATAHSDQRHGGSLQWGDAVLRLGAPFPGFGAPAFLWGVICPVLEPYVVCSLEIITPLGHVCSSPAFVSAVLGPKLCLPCALPQPLNRDLLLLFSLSLRK